MINALITQHFEEKVKIFSINWKNLSYNPKITWDFIKNHLDESWDWKVLTNKPFITREIIINHKNLAWDYDELSKRMSEIGWDFVIENIETINWKWYYLGNTKIPIDVLIKIRNKNAYIYESLSWSSLTEKYSDEEIRENPNLNWDWSIFFENHSKEALNNFFTNINDFSEEIIKKISYKIYFNHKIYDKIPWNFIMKNPDRRWSWNYFSFRKDLSLECLVNNFDSVDWNWKTLSKNPRITWEFVQSHKNYPWDFEYLSNNSNISYNIINKNPFDGWNLNAFQSNPNFLLSDEDLSEIIKKHHKICVIQRAWRKCISDPEYNVCRRRLKTECDELKNSNSTII